MSRLREDKTIVHIVIKKEDRKRLELFMSGQADDRDRNVSAAGRILILRALDALSAPSSTGRPPFDPTFT